MGRRMVNWILQDKDYGLGNFINLTSTIREIYETNGRKKVPVYFQSDYVRDAFMGSPYIDTLDEQPEDKPFMSSSWIDKSDIVPDWDFVWRKAGMNGPPRHTYIPVKKLAVFMNGCANLLKREAKSPTVEIYNHIYNKITTDYECVFVGSTEDVLYWSPASYSDARVIGNIRMAITLISKADIVVSNDTGLYHAAGAMKKKGFILWKDTLFTKNKSPNPNFTYSQKGNWQKDFDKWISTL